MRFKKDKPQSFEYKRNDFCHKILDALYFHAKPTIRENTFGNMMEGIEGLLISNKLYPPLDISELHKKFDVTDVFIQDCCDLLELNKQIEPTQKRNDIITQIKFTKLGVDAFKTDYYLKENQKQDYATQLRKSTLLNNWLTPIVALVTLVVSVVTLIIQRQESKDKQVTQEQFQQQLHSIDKMRQTETNALYLLLTNAQKNVSYHNDTTKTK